jgi:hypothetical protein
MPVKVITLFKLRSIVTPGKPSLIFILPCSAINLTVIGSKELFCDNCYGSATLITSASVNSKTLNTLVLTAPATFASIFTL